MKRSEINSVIREASAAFVRHGWTLPPHPCWDITDFGLGDFGRFGLVQNPAAPTSYTDVMNEAGTGDRTFSHHRGGARHAVGSLTLPPDFIQGAVGAGDAFFAGILYGLHEAWDYPARPPFWLLLRRRRTVKARRNRGHRPAGCRAGPRATIRAATGPGESLLSATQYKSDSEVGTALRAVRGDL